jgi:hypothetical protein
MLYEGYKCAECKKVFSADDDIVVCPECGAPHHRECFMKNGACTMSEYHGNDFKYQPEKSEEKILEDQGKKPENTPKFKEAPNNPFQKDLRESVLVYGGVNPEDKIDDIPVKVLARYVGTSSGSFIRKWKMIENGLGNGFSALAFLFGPYYLLFRKLWGIGLLYLLFNLVSVFPNCIYMLYDMSGKSGDISFWYNLSTVFSFISISVRAIVAFFFNRLYLSKAKKDLSAGKFHGGTSFLGVLLGLFITFDFSYILVFFFVK